MHQNISRAGGKQVGKMNHASERCRRRVPVLVQPRRHRFAQVRPGNQLSRQVGSVYNRALPFPTNSDFGRRCRG